MSKYRRVGFLRHRPSIATVATETTQLVLSQFKNVLSRVSILTRDINIANLSVCPSIRNVPVSDENGLTYRHCFFHCTVAQSFCFHQHQTSSRNSDGVTPCGGAKYKWGIKILFSTNKSLYLANDARYRNSYYRRRIGTAPKLSNVTNFNDLEWPLTPISRSRYYSTSKNSKMVQDRAIFAMADQ